MGLLVRDGKVVVRDGKAVTTDNPESCECCGAPDPECEHCLEGTIAPEIIVEFSGIANPVCCVDINLNADSFVFMHSGSCDWQYGIFCGFSYFMTMSVSITDTYIEVKIFWERDGSYIIFRREIDGPINCTSAIAGDVPYYDHFEIGDCGFSAGGTCTLSI